MKKFKIDYTFYLIIICFFFSPYQLLFFQVMLLLLFHELGHFFFIYLFKIDIISIKLSALGFIMEIDETKERWYSELLVSSGGVLFNLLTYIILSGTLKEYSLLLIVLNLFPIAPLDGNRLLRCVLSFFLPYKVSMITESLLNFLFLIIAGYFVIAQFDYLFLINYLYLWFIGLSKWKAITYKYSAFTLNRYLYPPKIMQRRVRFRENNAELLYRYQVIYSKLDNVIVSETDFLKLRYG